MRSLLKLAWTLATICPLMMSAQEEPSTGQITGNVQMLFQTYQEDTLIGAQVPPSKTGFNAFGNLIYTRGDFSAGMRYESYLDPILGYPGRFRGSGIGYRYANYSKEHFEVTIGNFYEQFGSGLVLRSYEERNLGIDNAMDGFRLILRPANGVAIKSLVGKQRFDFDSRLINSPGIIRAFDGEINLNDAFERWATAGTRVTLGASFVSRFQEGSTISKDTLVLQLPQNVGCWGYRAQVQKGGFQFMGSMSAKSTIPMPTTASRTGREKASSSMRVGPPRGSASTSALRASTTCSSVQTETSSCSICRSTTSRPSPSNTPTIWQRPCIPMLQWSKVK